MIVRFFGKQSLALAVALFTLLFAAATHDAKAACDSLTVTNNTNCDVAFSVRCPAGTILGPVAVPANSSVVYHLPAACHPFQVRVGVCGAQTLVPDNGCIEPVKVGGNCCAKVCYDAVNCTVTFTPVAGPCPCP